MKLTVKRDQSDIKGFFGGHKGVSFKLHYKCDIEPAERLLIEKYKIGEDIIESFESGTGDNKYKINITVNHLTRGNFEQTRNLGDLQSLEEKVVRACQQLKLALKVMSTFGGEETYEI